MKPNVSDVMPDPDFVELVRWLTETRQPVTHSEMEALFRAIDEREKSRVAAVRMGIAMASHLKDREDFQGKIARRFLEKFREEILPPKPSALDKLAEAESQGKSQVN